MRNGTLDDLVEFVQDSHRGVLVVDEQELADARKDPDTASVVAEAREALTASRRTGRRHEH